MPALLASAAAGAQAVPVAFANARHDTSVFAFSDAAANSNAAASPSPLPPVGSAVVAANDFASAFALADAGLLAASSEAGSYTGASGAGAGARSHFVGTVLGTGRLVLNLDFDSLDVPDRGTGGAPCSCC